MTLLLQRNDHDCAELYFGFRVLDLESKLSFFFFFLNVFPQIKSSGFAEQLFLSLEFSYCCTK